MSGWRTALRLARREARRARARSALVVALIAVPVAALSFGAVTYDTFRLTAAETATRQMGAASAVVSWVDDEQVRQEPDSLDAVMHAGQPASTGTPALADLLRHLPPGSHGIAERAGWLTVRTATGTGAVAARVLDYADPLARGIYRQVSGRAPASAGEVALTARAATRLGATAGGDVRLADGSRTFRVVGIVEDPTNLRAATIVLPDDPVPSFADRQHTRWLVATPHPLTWSEVKEANRAGIAAVSRYVLAHPPPAAERYRSFPHGPDLGIVVLVGGLALVEIVLLAGPAFAVGVRRRRRDLALVAAAGGTPAHVRRIVLADGVVLGAIAAGTGVVLGVATGLALRPWIEHAGHSRSGGFRVYPPALAGFAALAVVTGLLAALVPAWISSRQDVVVALTGRRGITRSRRRWLVVGLGLVAAGAALAGAGTQRVSGRFIMVGLVVVELGLVVCTPAIVGLVGRAGRWLPLPLRIALRDTSRNRTSAAPAISAVMAAVAGSLAVAVVVGATHAQSIRAHQPTTRVGNVLVFDVSGKAFGLHAWPPAQVTAVTAALRASVPMTGVYEIFAPSCAGGDCAVLPRLPASRACPYAPDLLRRVLTRAEQRAARRNHHCDGIATYRNALLGAPTVVIEPASAVALASLPAAEARRVTAALRAGQVVVDDARYVEGGRVALDVVTLPRDATRRDQTTTRTVSAPAVAQPYRPGLPRVLMSKATARSLGLDHRTLVLLATTSRMPTVAEQDRLQAALAPVGSDLYADVERGTKPYGSTSLLVLSLVAGVITLGAAALATGLAATDGRADLATLAAIGASPGVRRRLSLSQSGVIAGLGSLLGVVTGIGGATAILGALNHTYAESWPAPVPFPTTVPWLNVGIAAVVVPAVAMLGAGLLTRSRLPVERRL